MKKLKCTKEIARKAILMGACSLPDMKNEIKDFNQSDLFWARCLNIESDFPLWSLSKYGWGAPIDLGNYNGSGSSSGSYRNNSSGRNDFFEMFMLSNMLRSVSNMFSFMFIRNPFIGIGAIVLIVLLIILIRRKRR